MVLGARFLNGSVAVETHGKQPGSACWRTTEVRLQRPLIPVAGQERNTVLVVKTVAPLERPPFKTVIGIGISFRR